MNFANFLAMPKINAQSKNPPTKKDTNRLLLRLLITIFIAVLPHLVHARVPIEQMQREFQARFHFDTLGNYVAWPACRSGVAAPLFPPDGFYGNLDDDPLFATSLVQDIESQFYGIYAPVYAIGDDQFDNFWGDPLYANYWVQSDNLANQTGGPVLFTDSDFPTSGSGFNLSAITVSSYPACAAVLHAYILKLRYTESSQAGVVSVDTTNGLDEAVGAFTSTSDCAGAKSGGIRRLELEK